MIYESEELRATLRMIEAEHLDIRAVTMGISLRDCATDDLHRTCQRVYDKITRSARRLVDVAKEVEGAFGVPITNKRISVTPIALIGEPTRAATYVPLAETLDRAGAELGIDYVAGFSAHVEKGATPGDLGLLDSIPEALSVTQRVCSPINVATTRARINMDAVPRRVGGGDPGSDRARAHRRARDHRGAGAAHRRGQEGRRDGLLVGGRAIGRVHPGLRRSRHDRSGRVRRAIAGKAGGDDRG